MIFSHIATLSISLLFLSVNAQIFLPAPLTLEQVKSASKAFFWDLHHVPVIPHGLEKVGAGIITIPRGISAGFKVLGEKLGLRKNKKYSRALDAIKKLPKEASGDAYIEIFAQEGATDLVTMAQKLRNTYQPNQPVIDIIMQLHASGYAHYVASNIGPRALEALRDKISCSYHNGLFNILDKGLIVNYGKKPMTHCTFGNATYHLTPFYKPQEQFFIELKRLFGADPRQIPVFIDDSKKNIQAAVRQGFVGIWYDTSSHAAPQHLRNDLIAIGCAL